MASFRPEAGRKALTTKTTGGPSGKSLRVSRLIFFIGDVVEFRPWGGQRPSPAPYQAVLTESPERRQTGAFQGGEIQPAKVFRLLPVAAQNAELSQEPPGTPDRPVASPRWDSSSRRRSSGCRRPCRS